MGCCSSSPAVTDTSEKKNGESEPRKEKTPPHPNNSDDVPKPRVVKEEQPSLSPLIPAKSQPSTRHPHGLVVDETEGWGYDQSPDYSVENPKVMTFSPYSMSEVPLFESLSEGNEMVVGTAKAVAAAAAAKKNGNMTKPKNSSKSSHSIESDQTPLSRKLRIAPMAMNGSSLENDSRLRLSEEGVGRLGKIEEAAEMCVKGSSLSSVPKWGFSTTPLSTGISLSRPASGGIANENRISTPPLHRSRPTVTWSPKEGNSPTSGGGDSIPGGWATVVHSSPLDRKGTPSILDASKRGRLGGGGGEESSPSMRESSQNAFFSASMIDPADPSPSIRGLSASSDQTHLSHRSPSGRCPKTSPARVSPIITPHVSPNAFSHSSTDVQQWKKSMEEKESHLEESWHEKVLPPLSTSNSADGLFPTRSTPVLSPPASDGPPAFYPSPTRIFRLPSPSSTPTDGSPLLDAPERPRPASSETQRKPFWGNVQQETPTNEAFGGSPIQRFGTEKDGRTLLNDRMEESGGGGVQRGEHNTTASQNSPLSKLFHRRHPKNHFTINSPVHKKEKQSRVGSEEEISGQDQSHHLLLSRKHSSREGSRKRYGPHKREAGGSGGPSSKASSPGSSLFFDSTPNRKWNKKEEGGDEDMPSSLGGIPQNGTDLFQVSSSTSSYRLGDEGTTCSVELSQPTQYSMHTVPLVTGGGGGSGGGGGVGGGGGGGMGGGGNLTGNRMDSPLPRILRSVSGGNDSLTDVFSLGGSYEGGGGEMIEQARAREWLCAKEVDTRQNMYREEGSWRTDVIAMYVRELFMLERSKKLRKFFISRGEKLLRVTEMEERCLRKGMVRVCARQLRAWYDEWEQIRGRGVPTSPLLLQELPSPKMGDIREKDHEKDDEND